MNRMVATMCAVLLFSALAPAVAGTPDQSVTFLVVRTTSGASDFNLSVSAYLPAGGAFIGEVDASIGGGKVVKTFGGGIVSENSSEDGAHAGALQVRTCQVTTCGGGGGLRGLVGMGNGYSSGSSRGGVNALFVVARGSKVSYRLTGHGWRALRLPLGYRFVDEAAAGPATVSVSSYGVAAFTGASAPGGRNGSVAVASPPCSISTTNTASRGVGQVQLHGGTMSPTFTCPLDGAPLASFAPKGTIWALDGRAVGDSTLAKGALVVIDSPARLPNAAP